MSSFDIVYLICRMRVLSWIITRYTTSFIIRMTIPIPLILVRICFLIKCEYTLFRSYKISKWVHMILLCVCLLPVFYPEGV